MPVRRRRPKAREQLSEGQLLFLAGSPWPAPDEAYGHEGDPGAWYMENMRHCWLTSPWRSDEPSGGPTAAELWSAYGAEATAEWIKRDPGTRPPAWWRFDAPVPPEDGDEEVGYLRRHHLLTPAEVRLLGLAAR